MKRIIIMLVTAAAIILSGCESSPKLYEWGNYEMLTYTHLKKAEANDTQILAITNEIEKIEQKGKAFPPAIYAHLGMLYAEAGDRNQAIRCFETEKILFPESAVYMDFLIANAMRR